MVQIKQCEDRTGTHRHWLTGLQGTQDTGLLFETLTPQLLLKELSGFLIS